MMLGGKRDRSSANVEDKNGVLRGRLNSSANDGSSLVVPRSPQGQVIKACPNIAEGLDHWPENMPLGVQAKMQELTAAIRSLVNGKAVGPDEVSVELFKITLNDDPALRRRLLDIVVRIWRGGEVPQQ